jgi:hypothetical protein
MYKLYTDKSELFECDVKITGASLTKSKARLVVETSDYSLMFNGKIDSTGKCSIPIRKLRGLVDEDTKGSIKLEVIAEDTYFTPWTSDFEIQASKQVTVEVKSQNNKKITESVKVSNVKRESNDIKHVTNILKLLVHENIDLTNLTVRRDDVNHIIGVYTKHFPLTESQQKKVISGVLKGLAKK